MLEISYIVNSDKPYPEWIKDHRVFKSLPKIEKIFPRIGLPNFTEMINVYATDAAATYARQIVSFLGAEINARIVRLKAALVIAIDTAPSKERNERCNALQNAINVLTSTYYTFVGKETTSVVEGKVIMGLPADVFSGATTAPIFKKGEALLKVVTKINSVLAEIDPASPMKIDYESNASFKEFSRLNVPSKEYKLTFGSTGPDGAWDIATASMRGIASCQSWTAAQSRGLIGSITSKYVGIVYIHGTGDYAPYGKQMMFRSLIRLVINKTTGTPALYMDTMYPSYNPDIYSAIKNNLEAKSGLRVYSSSAGDRDFIVTNFHLLNEHSRSFLREGEYSYMDSILTIQDRKTPILFEKENKVLTERRRHFTDKLEALIARKRALYTKGVAELKSYMDSGEKDESKRPELAKGFADVKKGKNSFQNTLNFFKHCDGGHATTNKPTTYFLAEIFKVMGSPSETFVSSKDCDSWLLRTLVGNWDKVRDQSWAILKAGSWYKAFPSSSKRFHDTIMADLKKELMVAFKENA